MSNEESLFALTPAEFELFCRELLRVRGFHDIEMVGGPSDQGVDLIGRKDNRSVVVQAKHRRRLHFSAIRHDLNRIVRSSYHADLILIITSAPITAGARAGIQEGISGTKVEIWGQADILQSISEHPELGETIGIAKCRTAKQTRSLGFGAAAVIASVLGVVVNITAMLTTKTDGAGLKERITSVEQAIGNLKDLEGQLTGIKEDMVETEKAKQAIEAEYAKAKELEKLTGAQLAAVKTALLTQSWQKTVIDYVLGFVLGVGGSLAASVIYTRIQQRRALTAD